MIRYLKYLTIFTCLTIAIIIITGYTNSNSADIGNFEECSNAGYPIMETYPEQCKTPDGRVFTREISSKEITVTGQAICLPHKNSQGPQALECAFGLETENGNYAIIDSQGMFLLDSRKTVTITGQLFQDPDSTYDTIGVIEVVSVSD